MTNWTSLLKMVVCKESRNTAAARRVLPGVPVKQFALWIGHVRQFGIATVGKAGATSETQESEACTSMTYLQARHGPLWNQHCSYCGFSQRSIISLHILQRTIRVQLLYVMCSQADFMRGRVKQCSSFRLSRGRARFIMEASPVFNMRSLRFNILRCGSIPDGMWRYQGSITTITDLKRFGLLLKRLPTHRIFYLMFMLHTACLPCCRFALISSIMPVAWWW